MVKVKDGVRGKDGEDRRAVSVRHSRAFNNHKEETKVLQHAMILDNVGEATPLPIKFRRAAGLEPAAAC